MPATLYAVVSKIPGVGCLGTYRTLGEAQLACRGRENVVIVTVPS